MGDDVGGFIAWTKTKLTNLLQEKYEHGSNNSGRIISVKVW